MINPVQTRIPQPDGTARYVIIEPIIEQGSGGGFKPTGVYKIYKDAFGDESHLFTEPAELGEVNDELPDEQNPDYLGKLLCENGRLANFESQVLNAVEQNYLSAFIESYPGK